MKRLLVVLLALPIAVWIYGKFDTRIYYPYYHYIAGYLWEARITRLKRELLDKNPQWESPGAKTSVLCDSFRVSGIPYCLDYDRGPYAPALPVDICYGEYSLDIDGAVSDFSPLKGMKLESVSFRATKLCDLSVFNGMPLAHIAIINNLSPVDLSLLVDFPVDELKIHNTEVSAFPEMQKVPTRSISLSGEKVMKLPPLNGVKLIILDLSNSGITDLNPLRGAQVKYLCIHNTRITDLTPLSGIELERLDISPEQAELIEQIDTSKIGKIYIQGEQGRKQFKAGEAHE